MIKTLHFFHKVVVCRRHENWITQLPDGNGITGDGDNNIKLNTEKLAGTPIVQILKEILAFYMHLSPVEAA